MKVFEIDVRKPRLPDRCRNKGKKIKQNFALFFYFKQACISPTNRGAGSSSLLVSSGCDCVAT